VPSHQLSFYSLALTQIKKETNPLMYEYQQGKIKQACKRKLTMMYAEPWLVNIVYRIMKDKVPYVPL
jgi:hypothetical protein